MRFNLPQDLLSLDSKQFVLCTFISVWFKLATKQDKNGLRRAIRSAERISTYKVLYHKISITLIHL